MKISSNLQFRNAELPTGEVVDVLFAPNPRNSCNTCIRPVNAVFNKAGHLIVTADATNEIFRVVYNAGVPAITNVEGPMPSGSNRPFMATILIFIVTIVVLINL